MPRSELLARLGSCTAGVSLPTLPPFQSCLPSEGERPTQTPSSHPPSSACVFHSPTLPTLPTLRSCLPSEGEWPAVWQRQKELHMARVAADRAAKKAAVRASAGFCGISREHPPPVRALPCPWPCFTAPSVSPLLLHTATPPPLSHGKAGDATELLLSHPPTHPCRRCLFVPQEQRKKEEAAEKAAAADKEGGADAADAKAEAAAAEEAKEEPIPEPAMPARPQLQVGLCLHQLGFSCVAVVGLVWQGIEREEKERPSPLPAGEFRAPACLQLHGGCVVGVARSRGGGAGSQGPLQPQLQVCSAVAHHAAKRGAGDQRCPLGRSCG